MKLSARPLQTSVTTTKRGRRYVVCPACTAVNAPIPVGTTRHTCKACGGEFNISEARTPRKREVGP